MRNSLRLVLDRNTNQLIVVTPLHTEHVEGPRRASIDEQCIKTHHDAFTRARQDGKPFEVAWAMADEAARGLREQMGFAKGQVAA